MLHVQYIWKEKAFRCALETNTRTSYSSNRRDIFLSVHKLEHYTSLHIHFHFFHSKKFQVIEEHVILCTSASPILTCRCEFDKKYSYSYLHIYTKHSLSWIPRDKYCDQPYYILLTHLHEQKFWYQTYLIIHLLTSNHKRKYTQTSTSIHTLKYHTIIK